MIKKRLLILSLTLLAAGIGFFAFRQTGPTPPKIIAQRDLAIQGKDPCPQCKNSLCNKNQDGTCQLNHD